MTLQNKEETRNMPGIGTQEHQRINTERQDSRRQQVYQPVTRSSSPPESLLAVLNANRDQVQSKSTVFRQEPGYGGARAKTTKNKENKHKNSAIKRNGFVVNANDVDRSRRVKSQNKTFSPDWEPHLQLKRYDDEDDLTGSDATRRKPVIQSKQRKQNINKNAMKNQTVRVPPSGNLNNDSLMSLSSIPLPAGLDPFSNPRNINHIYLKIDTNPDSQVSTISFNTSPASTLTNSLISDFSDSLASNRSANILFGDGVSNDYLYAQKLQQEYDRENELILRRRQYVPDHRSYLIPAEEHFNQQLSHIPAPSAGDHYNLQDFVTANEYQSINDSLTNDIEPVYDPQEDDSLPQNHDPINIPLESEAETVQETEEDVEKNARQEIMSDSLVVRSEAETVQETKEDGEEQYPETFPPREPIVIRYDEVSQIPDSHQQQLPKEITDMDEKTVETYIRALEKGKTKYNNIRIMVVGHFKVGKTTLVNRLFGQFEDQEITPSTNGIETHVRQCNVILDDEIEKMIWKPLKDGNQTNWRQVLLQRTQSITEDDTSEEKIETTLVTESELQPHGTEEHAISTLENVERSDAAVVSQSSEEHKDIVQNEVKEPVLLPESEEELTQEQQKLNQQECVMRLVQNTPKDLVDNTNKINISVWDFAGQYAFYNTHQVFLTRRAIYLIVTDMSKDITDEVNDTGFEDSRGGRKLRVVDFARFWLNSIHEFCETEKKSEPPVLLIGTFADEYARKQNIDETKYPVEKKRLEQKYFYQLRKELGNGEAKKHILKHFMIDNTCTIDGTSSQFEQLKKEILEISKTQRYIGDLIPTKFLLLEEALDKKRKEGTKILNKDVDFSKCNEELPFKLDEKEMDVFLRFYHEVGSIIYFNALKNSESYKYSVHSGVGVAFVDILTLDMLCIENVLKDYILLDPQWLIDAFKELITAEEFMLNGDTETFEVWRQFSETAMLKKDLIDKCWEGKVMSERILLLEYMEKLGLIVKDREKQDSYFAPCVLKQAPSESLLKLGDIKNGGCPFSSDEKTFTSKLCYTTKSKFIPMGIFNRLLADCMSRWDIRRQKNDENGEERVDIYCGCGIFSLQNAHILYVHFRDNVVQIWIVRCSKKSPSKEICLEVKKHMDDFFEKVFKKCEVERHFKCPTGPSWKDAMYPHDKLKKDSSVYCDCHEHELPSLDLTGCWFSDDRNDGDTKDVADSGILLSGSSRQIGQPFKKEYDDTLSESMMAALHEQMKSVGVLFFHGKPIGTVFRVGSRYVMTAFHVINIVLDPSKSGSPNAARLESDGTYISFNESPYITTVAYKLKKEFICNVNLDVAVIEIQDAFNLPKKLNLRKAATGAANVSLIGYGHPGDSNKHLDPKCHIVTPNSKRLQATLADRSELEKMGINPSLVDKEYQDFDHSSKILFDCFIEHGASGAPALTYNNQVVEVVGILTVGLPELYYCLPENMKRHFPNSLRLEGGAKMQSIFEWITASVPADIVQDLFD